MDELYIDLDPKEGKGPRRLATPIERYRYLSGKLKQCRALEEEILARMDVAWNGMTNPERQEVDPQWKP